MINIVPRPPYYTMRWLWLGIVLSSLTGNAFARDPHVITIPNGINSFGVVVGYYQFSNSSEINSFVDNKTIHFVNFSAPLATGDTVAYGINDHDAVVGIYYTSISSEHGFLFVNGGFQTIDYPNSTGTFISGINNSNNIVGYGCSSTGCQSFEYSNGVFTVITDPLAITSGTSVYGINNLGEIAGTSDIAGVAEGFVYSGGAFTHFSVPGSVFTSAGGINDGGSVVGNFIATPHGPVQGYLYSGGKFTTIDFPGAFETILTGINNAGAITGSALDIQNGRKTTDAGFVYQNGVFTVISDLGHSNPIPEPASWTLMIVGLGGLGTALRQSRRVRRRAA